MHKDAKVNGSWIGIPLSSGDRVQVIRNDEIMFEYTNPYDDAEFSTYLKRLNKPLDIK